MTLFLFRFTCSDLFVFLRDRGVRVEFFTTAFGVESSHSELSFYEEDFDIEAKRVNELFALAKREQWPGKCGRRLCVQALIFIFIYFKKTLVELRSLTFEEIIRRLGQGFACIAALHGSQDRDC